MEVTQGYVIPSKFCIPSKFYLSPGAIFHISVRRDIRRARQDGDDSWHFRRYREGTNLLQCWIICTAYIAKFGPVPGNRTSVIARFTMGYFPSIFCVLLNLVIEIGYGVVDCIVCELILSAVSGRSMSPLVGVFISAIIS
jgi:hypothetical protein